MPVMKADGTIRICGDFKLTVNKVSKLDRYPLPRIEDLFTNLSGGVAFIKLGLSQAYQQLELDDVSKQFTVINTHRGLSDRIVFHLGFRQRLEYSKDLWKIY